MTDFIFLNPEEGFTSGVIKSPNRFVGRAQLVKEAYRSICAKSSLVTVFGKRGVGKSSLLRQIQNMATGDLTILERSGLSHIRQKNERKYYTVFYTCDSTIKNYEHLLSRICTDTDDVDGLIRLLPEKGKTLSEFSRSGEASGGVDIKVVKWGGKAGSSSKYVDAVKGDIVQIFRNHINSIIDSLNQEYAPRDGVLILIDEFDVIQDKTHIGSLIKALSSDKIKFAISGIGEDITALVDDHGSIERLVEQGYAHVLPMDSEEIERLFITAEHLFDEPGLFDAKIFGKVWEVSEGYPYFAQLIGKSCVEKRNELGLVQIDEQILDLVLEDIGSGKAFPSLERRFQRAVGDSDGRAVILTLLAEQAVEITDVDGQVSLKEIRAIAQSLDVDHIDQLVPRLADKKYGPAIVKRERGRYEFSDPVLRAYVKLRKL